MSTSASLPSRPGVEIPGVTILLEARENFVGACAHLGLPYESHRLQAYPDKKGSTSELQQ